MKREAKGIQGRNCPSSSWISGALPTKLFAGIRDQGFHFREGKLEGMQGSHGIMVRKLVRNVLDQD